MILQALKEYYDRKAADPDSGIAPEGFEKKEIPFLVVIKPDGQFVNLEDTRQIVGKRSIGKIYLLPRSFTRTGSRSYEKTFLLWDHIGYLVGACATGEASSLEKASNQHKTWLKSLELLPHDLKQDEGVGAILSFYRSNGVEQVKSAPCWHECTRLPSCNMTFRLAGDALPIPCRPNVRSHVIDSISPIKEETEVCHESKTKVLARCLVTGEYGEVAGTHGRTPINKDTKSLVAIQKNAGYDSYGKEQCYNAPVSKSSEFAYTTALNTLLKSRNQRLHIADTTAVFWSARRTEFERVIPLFFSEPSKDDPDQAADAINSIYTSIWSGAYVIPDDDTRFYVLGLAPNAARISVRFWKAGTVKEIGERMKWHVDDLAIAYTPGQNPALPMWRLLRSIAVREEDKNIPPNVGGETMRAILEGLPYPRTLLQAAIRRIRSEQSKKDNRNGKTLPNVTYERAALIKACLNRALRRNNTSKEEELKVSLDEGNSNTGYRLGRLFATLEKIQQEAHPGINATIRDKFYGAASCTPVTVFGNLMRLTNHHLAKLENVGRRVNLERLLGQIVDGIGDFPPHLKLEDQGRFAIGYYHQMQSFFTKKAE